MKNKFSHSMVRFLVSWHKADGSLWVRICGKGVSAIDRTKHKPLFSERMGITKSVKILNWSFKLLS